MGWARKLEIKHDVASFPVSWSLGTSYEARDVDQRTFYCSGPHSKLAGFQVTCWWVLHDNEFYVTISTWGNKWLIAGLSRWNQTPVIFTDRGKSIFPTSTVYQVPWRMFWLLKQQKHMEASSCNWNRHVVRIIVLACHSPRSVCFCIGHIGKFQGMS